MIEVNERIWNPNEDILYETYTNLTDSQKLEVWYRVYLHPSLERSGSLVIRMPGWPWLPWLVLAGLGGVGVFMLMSDEGRAQLVSMGALTLLIVGIYFARQLLGSRKRA